MTGLADGSVTLLNDLVESRVLVMVRASHRVAASGLVGCLAESGARVMEITLTTPGALDVIGEAVGRGLTVGAGTVTSAHEARNAIAAGAEFLVSPGLERGIFSVAEAHGVPMIPGALTPTEIQAAQLFHPVMVKLFPASVGGARYLRDLRGPFPDIRLMASGGVTTSNAKDFIQAGAQCVVAGTAVLSERDLEQQAWGRISERFRRFREGLEPTT